MTISVETSLDVQEKYKALVEQSLTEGSVYIRSKETLTDMFDKGYIRDEDIATVLTGILTNINNTILSSSMGTALQWASAEKELVLKKAQLEAQLDLLTEQVAAAEVDTRKRVHEDIAIQANTIREYGTPTVVDNNVVALTDSGKAYFEANLTEEKVTSEIKAQLLADAKLKETQASVNKIVADMYANYGMLNGYTITDSGISGITDNTPVGYTPLSEIQAAVAKEQAKGYSYNAWANAASGLGSTIGVALTSETDIFSGANASILTSWKSAVDKLNTVPVPTFN